ncbi:hypothetical protein CROQUDRAFT_35536 [Cronartium quercuum f. sp. fusiforme G11]|uniref:Translation initiation factor eIF2B subunit beta n=1 Tax=Cronartium quercuum f. sp. fusiforme G11 TaxID=708437 RepID=A0A9P6NSD2_9BASI|nr:hypothetical protein CROQUDRAFT_35536 [Cronartium quercuum f. sp. fusiforme G11]
MTTFAFSTDVSKPLVLKRIEALAQKLQRRQLIGSLPTALETIKILREVISSAKLTSFEQLCTHLCEVGTCLSLSAPREFVIQNMVKRVVILLREEYASALATHLSAAATPAIEKDEPTHLPPFRVSGPPGRQLGFNATSTACPSPSVPGTLTPNPGPDDSIFRLLGQRLASPSLHDDETEGSNSKTSREFSRRAFSLKPIFIEAVQELHDELELTRENVAAQAGEHIHSGEVIMTMDHSRTVQSFLQAASKSRRTFTVIVAETAPTFTGRTLAAELASSVPPITTVTVSDASTYALMARCTKVIIGCHAVFADGSILAKAGALGLARAAKAHLVPVVVVGGMYKFSPEFVRAGEDWTISDLQSPEEVLRLDENDDQNLCGGSECGEVEVLNPYYDRVPSELVNLFITNLGGHPASLVYRLLKDLYGSA